MKFKYIILLFLLVGLVFPACEAQFNENVTIRALDVLNRPIPNVSILITYQVSQSRGYTTISPKLTNSNGIFSTILHNIEEDEGAVDCDITISATYDGKTETETIVAGSHPVIIDLKLDVHYLTVRVVDHKGKSLQGAKVVINDFEKITDEVGRAIFRVGEGSVNVIVNYQGGERSEYVDVSQDTEYEFSYFTSNLKLTVKDDQENPLEAIVSFAGEQYETEAGSVTLENIGTSFPVITIIYEGREKTPEIDLSKLEDYTIIFDTHAPTIESVSVDYKDGLLKFILIINDKGKYASGISPEGITLEYSLGAEWKKAKVYYKSFSTYIAEISDVPVGSVVVYKLSIADKEGMTATKEGSVSVLEEQDGINISDDGNGNLGGEDDENKGGFNWITLIGGLIILGILGYLVWTRFIKKQQEV